MSEQEPRGGAASPEPELEPTPESTPEPEPEAPTEVHAPSEAAPVAPPAPRRLERSWDDRVIAGVCGGLGEYFGVDAVLIRIAALILVFAGGAGILLYAIGWIAMPEAAAPGTPEAATAAPSRAAGERTTGAVAIGIAFVVLGAFFLADEIWSDFLAWRYVWPIALIAVGAAVLVRSRR